MAIFNFRLFVRPTLIGKAIIARLTAEGTDRQADARRWLELGYAVEQAGFRLDGTTVFHGGRAVVAGQPVAVEIPNPGLPLVDNSSRAAPQEPAQSVGTELAGAGSNHNGVASITMIAPPAQVPASPAVPVGAPTPIIAAVDASVEAATPSALSAPAVVPSPLADDMAANLRSLSL
jgi:hypothetical protein